MTPDTIKRMLQDTARAMMDLHDRIGKGKEMGNDDKELCRMAMLPSLTQTLEEIKYSFVSGDVEHFEGISHSLPDQFSF